jgi:hypothetical protein
MMDIQSSLLLVIEEQTVEGKQTLFQETVWHQNEHLKPLGLQTSLWAEEEAYQEQLQKVFAF